MEKSNLFWDNAKKWGLIYGLAGLIYQILTAMLINSIEPSTSTSIISFLITSGLAFSIYLLSTREYRKENDNLIGFGKAYLICIAVGTIGGIIRGLGFYLYIKFIDINYPKNFFEAQAIAQEKAGMPSVPEGDLPSFFEFFKTAEFLSISVFISVLLGSLLIGLIASAINKRKEEFNY
jgi:hypothetical protein